jgi:hypothetical protein
MHTIIHGLDRERLIESLPALGFVFAMAAIAAIFMMVAVLGLVSTP